MSVNPAELLPHRPPFLFLDEVVELHPHSIIAVRRFRPEEDFFKGHFPDYPIVPGVILVEAMAQAFAYLMIHQYGIETVYLTGIDRARFRKPVIPNDLVTLRVKVEGERMGLVTAKGEATVEGAKVADARLIGRAG